MKRMPLCWELTFNIAPSGDHFKRSSSSSSSWISALKLTVLNCSEIERIVRKLPLEYRDK